MKKVILLLSLVFLLGLSATASAANHNRHDWSHHSYRGEKWRQVNHRESVNVNWHQRRDSFSPARYRMERIRDHQWSDRFPGLKAYRWHDRHGEGFWYRGHRVTNAVYFFDRDRELVSIGFMHNGTFIFIRDDNHGYENHDTVLISWWDRHRD